MPKAAPTNGTNGAHGARTTNGASAAPGGLNPSNGTSRSANGSSATSPPEPAPVAGPTYRAHQPSGLPLVFAACGLVGVLVVGTRVLGQDTWGVVIIPAIGILLAMAFARRCARVRPDEPWLPRLMLAGAVAKLVASYFRFATLTLGYGGAGDATEYDKVARQFVGMWIGQPELGRPPPLINYRQSNFVRLITSWEYYVFGRNLLAAFLLFGMIALVGSYFWYRAVVDAVPSVNKRLFLAFMLFAPSIVFWPSSLGKEALMQVGVGGIAWATCMLLTGRFVRALPLAAGCGWLLWIVRPHLLALVTVAAAVPYFVGRVNRAGKASFLARPVGMVAVALLVVFTVTAGAEFLGVQDLSVDAIEAQLDATTERTATGGSEFDPGDNSLSPLNVPEGFITVLFRPFPWEASGGFALLAALESAVLIGLIVRRWGSVRLGIARSRREPFLLYCIMLLLSYSLTFSSFANFGLLNRQRSLVLPALYVFIAIEPALLARGQREDVPLAVGPRAGPLSVQ